MNGLVSGSNAGLIEVEKETKGCDNNRNPLKNL